MMQYCSRQLLRIFMCGSVAERNIHVSANCCNHYHALGISKSSTQSEIKAAYYKLSMIYHPDKNQGSDSAAKKFREISQAYEVLGNYRLRRLYDKGIIHTAGSHYAGVDIKDDIEPEIEDDPETKFYKSRFKRTKVADTQGRTPIYDFDEWSREHYGKSFDRRQAAKEKYDRLQAQKAAGSKSKENDIVMFTVLFGCVAIYLMFMSEASYDTPRERAEARHTERVLREKEESKNS